MRRLLALSVMSLLPLVAAQPSWAADSQDMAQQLLAPQTPASARDTDFSAPMWLGGSNPGLLVRADDRLVAPAAGDMSLAFGAADTSSLLGSTTQYRIAPSLQAHAGLVEHAWNNTPYRVLGSEVGATYVAGRYSLGLSVGTDKANGAARLPRVLPGVSPGVNGLNAFDSSAQLNARGRLALDGNSGIDLGASVGRIHLLPGNLLGVDTLDQKALSFGVDRGPLSGSLVGRVMQPAAGLPGGYSVDRRWSSIDFGVTWKLPWQGQLSVGAQNLWSSGSPVNTPAGPEPDQSRTPYVQYHQDL
ncbi:hypothetical protein [Dyella sp.]|jgi:hypothetical protein|uniref:hypothetical protein n=1 Tax=Dyella sp. TaxID=1869338 RepID=UPI002D7713C9|nr:hypothetical protein [Dyella sp.]HET6430783.1 hypothetical protein [Dyella sp.]